MITDQLPLCERCGLRAGRPYQVHWGTLERRPLRDDQESGGYVIIQNGYRIDGSLTVSLCDRCAYWSYNLALARTAITLVFVGGLIWLAVAAHWLHSWSRVALYHATLFTFIVFHTAYGRRLRACHPAAECQACDLARKRGRIPLWATALTRAQLARLGPPDPAGVRWERV
jgi:hypothetical protein